MNCQHEKVKCLCCGLEGSPGKILKEGKKSSMTDAERLQRSNAGKLRWSKIKKEGSDEKQQETK